MKRSGEIGPYTVVRRQSFVLYGRVRRMYWSERCEFAILTDKCRASTDEEYCGRLYAPSNRLECRPFSSRDVNNTCNPFAASCIMCDIAMSLSIHLRQLLSALLQMFAVHVGSNSYTTTAKFLHSYPRKQGSFCCSVRTYN